MCVASPGKVIQVKGNKAKVQQSDHEHWLDISMIDEGIKVGDYLLSYQEAAINKISAKQAKEILSITSHQL